MEIIIDCYLLAEENDFYTQLVKQVDLGKFFGGNLDALWDSMGFLYERKVVFVNSRYLSQEMILFINKIIKLIHESNVSHRTLGDKYQIALEIKP